MDEEHRQILDEQVWEATICDPGKPCGATCPGPKRGEVCYYDAEVVADAEVLRIFTEAQKNVTELGYWRDVATGLSALVDRLRTELVASRRRANVAVCQLSRDGECIESLQKEVDNLVSADFDHTQYDDESCRVRLQ